MINYKKTLVLPIIMLVIKCNCCYSSDSLELDQGFCSTIDDSNKALKLNKHNVYRKPIVTNSRKNMKNKIKKLQGEFDNKIDEVMELQVEILEKFPQCEETDNIFKLITQFKKLCYLPSIQYNSEKYVKYDYNEIVTKLEQFLPEDSAYKQVMKKLNKDHYNKKITNINSIQLDDEQIELIEHLLLLFKDIFGIYSLIFEYNLYLQYS